MLKASAHLVPPPRRAPHANETHAARANDALAVRANETPAAYANDARAARAPKPFPRRATCVAFALVALLSAGVAARAQNSLTGAFEGTVSHAGTRARIAGARVEITNLATRETIFRYTDSQGRFYQGLLPSGVYLIRVSFKGFYAKEKVQHLLNIGSHQVVPIPFLLDPDTGASQPAPPAQAAAGQPPRPPLRPSPQPSPFPTPLPTPPSSPSPAATPAANISDAAERDVVAEVNRNDAQRSGAFTAEEVSTLPLGVAAFVRSFDELALLLPGVAPPPQTLGSVAGPGIGAGVGSAGQFSVNGLRSRANNFTVDGSDNNDEDIGVRRQGFVALTAQPVESIREYQVITLLAPAQFGRNIGAQVNAVSKSGGNETHGTFHAAFNSSQLNARNPFDTTNGTGATPARAGGKPVFLNNRPLNVTNKSGGEDSYTFGQGGFVLGGALAPHDVARPGQTLFYFMSAEGQFTNATQEASFAVPTIEQRGLFRSGASGLAVNPFNGAPVVSFPTTVSGDAVFSLFPFPNNPAGVYGENTLTHALPAGGQSKALSGKVDGNFKVRDRQQSVTARYNFSQDFRDIPVTGGAIFSTLRPRVRAQNLSLYSHNELSRPGAPDPTFNQIRASYGRTRLVFDERRDTEFLLPSERAGNLPPGERQFLLNAPMIVNDTLPGSARVRYDNFGFLQNFTVADFLGAVGQVSIAGFSPVGVDVFNFPQRRVNNTYQLADTLTMHRGAHDLAFGFDLRRSELNSDLPRNARPLITFDGAPRLVESAGGVEARGFFDPVDLAAASAPSGVFQAVTPGSGSAINLRYYQFNYFAQDYWRVRPNLSLSFGLRYEYNTPPRESNRRIENTFNDPALDLVPGLRAFIGGRTNIFDPDRNNFAPRLSAAYAPGRFGRERLTVLRAGFGVFYDQALGAVVSQSRNVFPNFLTLNFAGGLPLGGELGFNIRSASNPLFPCEGADGVQFVPVTERGTLNRLNPGAPLPCLVEINSAFPGGFGFTLPARRLASPEAYHYTFSLEQQLGRAAVLSLAYVGTQGRHLLRLTTPNLGPNALLSPTRVDVLGNVPNISGLAFGPGQRVGAGGALTGGRPVGGAGAVFIYESNASSRYDSLQAQLRGRLRRSLQYQIAYTLSKVEDDASDVFDLAGAPALPQNSLTLAGERAPANFDVRHRLTYNFIYDLPSALVRPRPLLLRLLLGGLQIAGAGRLQTGQPFTVNSIYDVNLDGNLTDRLNTTEGIVSTGDRRQPLRLTVSDPSALLAPAGQDGRVSRNTFRAGNIIELDLSVTKNFISDMRQRLILRADIFNFINRANYNIPVRLLGAPAFGQPVNILTTPRRLQLTLKYSF
jgi:hypothetical protein